MLPAHTLLTPHSMEDEIQAALAHSIGLVNHAPRYISGQHGIDIFNNASHMNRLPDYADPLEPGITLGTNSGHGILTLTKMSYIRNVLITG